MEREEEKIALSQNNINDINKKLDRLNSLSWTFLRGLVGGVGTAIGATIIAGLLFTFLASAIRNAENIPFIDQLIEKSHLKEIIINENS